MRSPRIRLACAGSKGLDFATAICASQKIDRIFAYEQSGTTRPTIAEFISLGKEAGIRVEAKKKLTGTDLSDADLIFVVGWQYMIENPPPSVVVLHDSLLPKYRGFAPTVSALIEGAPEIGITAITAMSEPDRGLILSQSKLHVTHPVKIRDVLGQLQSNYMECAHDVIQKWQRGSLVGTAQQEEFSTYSLWRDELDLMVDWSCDAARVQRFIYAVGDPYLGARASIDGQQIVISDCVVVEDLSIVNRQPGKIWRLTAEGPEVVCGRGMIRLTEIRDLEGNPFVVRHLRTRL